MNTDKSVSTSDTLKPQSSSPAVPQVARRDFIKASAFGALAAAGAAFLPQMAKAQEEPAPKAARFGNASTHYEFAVGLSVLYGDRVGPDLI